MIRDKVTTTTPLFLGAALKLYTRSESRRDEKSIHGAIALKTGADLSFPCRYHRVQPIGRV